MKKTVKEITCFVCDNCGVAYLDEYRAINCERNHRQELCKYEYHYTIEAEQVEYGDCNPMITRRCKKCGCENDKYIYTSIFTQEELKRVYEL